MLMTRKLYALIGIAAVILLLAWPRISFLYVVAGNSIGVVTRFGAFNRVSGSGISYKIPLIENVFKIDMTPQAKTIRNIEVSTKEGDKILLNISFRYTPNPASMGQIFRTNYLQIGDALDLHSTELMQKFALNMSSEDFILNRNKISKAVREELKAGLSNLFSIENATIDQIVLPSYLERVLAQKRKMDHDAMSFALRKQSRQEQDAVDSFEFERRKAKAIEQEKLRQARLDVEAQSRLNRDLRAMEALSKLAQQSPSVVDLYKTYAGADHADRLGQSVIIQTGSNSAAKRKMGKDCRDDTEANVDSVRENNDCTQSDTKWSSARQEGKE